MSFPWQNDEWWEVENILQNSLSHICVCIHENSTQIQWGLEVKRKSLRISGGSDLTAKLILQLFSVITEYVFSVYGFLYQSGILIL